MSSCRAGSPRRARHAGVRRIVHVSALGADSQAPSRYLRSKAAGEAALASPPIDLTVLRPSVIFGEGDRFLNLFARLQSVFPVIPLAGAEARFQPVWVDDVALAIVRCLDDRTTIGETLECCGPEVYTLGATGSHGRAMRRPFATGDRVAGAAWHACRRW